MTSGTPPTVFGSEDGLRKALARYIKRGEELLDQASGVRRRIAKVDPDKLSGSLVIFAAQDDWVRDVRRWRRNALDSLVRYLADETDVRLPCLTEYLPPDTGKPRHQLTIDNLEPWVLDVVAELKELRDAMGVRRAIAKKATTARFAELRASGLVEEEVVVDLEARMSATKTPRQLQQAIGAAKELTEATLRGALDRLGVTWTKKDDLPKLMKKWRSEVKKVAPPDTASEQVLDNAQASLAGVVTFLAAWRNAYGSGHGRPRIPKGLALRHALLAADACSTIVRFIALTMDDLGRLPPQP